MGEEVGQTDEDIAEDFERGLAPVEAGDEFFGIVFEQFQGILSINFHPGAEDVGIHVVGLFRSGPAFGSV